MTNYFLANTMGKLFTGGRTTKCLRDTVLKLNSKGTGVILNYLAEFEPGVVSPEEEFDHNCQMTEMMVTDSKVDFANNYLAIKITGIMNLDSLRKASSVQNKIDNLFHKNSNASDFVIEISQLRENLLEIGINFTEDDFKSFVELIKMSDCDIVRETANNADILSIAEWRTQLTCVNWTNPEMNSHQIFLQLSDYSEEELIHIRNCKKRYFGLCELGFMHSLTMIVDAEQTYLQDAIRALVEQAQFIFNKNGQSVINTYQAYLKDTRKQITIELLKRSL